MPTKTPSPIDDYLATVPAAQRAALESLRKNIHAAAPGAEECLSYGMPAFRLDGQLIAGFKASAKHLGYYPMSGTVITTLGDALADFATSKGTIKFTPERPLPVALVKRLVKARIAERT